MKRFLAILLGIALATAALAKDFEGKLDMTMTVGKKTMPMTYFIKGQKIRFEMKPDAKTTSVGLVDSTTGEMTMLMPEQKMYMTISLKGAADKMTPDFTFEETGRTETIAGKKCSEYIVRDKKLVMEIWATSELGGVANISDAFSQRGKRSAWESELVRRNLFALRTIARNKKGAEQSRMECTAITEDSLDDALFKVPADYTKMPGLGDLFGR